MDLLEARFKRRKTQWDVSKTAGISQSKMSLLERGYIIPTDKEKELIAKALGFRVSEIEWPVEQNGDLNSLMTSNFKK
jgi:transcriptional regulator with XRE-family HTH domain